MKDGKYFDIFEGNAFSRYIYIYQTIRTNTEKPTLARARRISLPYLMTGRTIDNSRSQSNRPVQFMNRGTIVNRATPFVFRLVDGRTKGARNCRDFALYESINA